MERVEFDGVLLLKAGDLLPRLLPSKLAVHIAIIKHGTCYSKIELFIDFRRRLVTALDAELEASGVYTLYDCYVKSFNACVVYYYDYAIHCVRQSARVVEGF